VCLAKNMQGERGGGGYCADINVFHCKYVCLAGNANGKRGNRGGGLLNNMVLKGRKMVLHNSIYAGINSLSKPAGLSSRPVCAYNLK